MLANITDWIETTVASMGFWAPIFACLLIIIESILPVLPLCAFITINFISFGNIIGFIISWVFTCIGCFLSYYLVKKGFRKYNREIKENPNMMDKCMNYVKNVSLPTFTVILAIPFTPAFMMNIAAALAGMEFKKFAKAVLIGKIFMVYFWGFIGVSLIESFKNPIILVKVVIMVLIAFVISKIVNDKLK
jgi:uncharacterized membrane protein YdjX (TVP38/TMEM64 family)